MNLKIALLITLCNIKLHQCLIHENIYKNCENDKKFCIGSPKDCEKTQNCKALGTFSKSVKKREEKFIFEMMSDVNSNYVALGLSFDDKMGDDSVMECVKKQTEIKFFTSKTGVEKGIRVAKRNDELQENLSLTLKHSELFEGRIYCRIERESKIDSERFLMLAVGDYVNDHSIDYHEIAEVARINKILNPFYASTRSPPSLSPTMTTRAGPRFLPSIPLLSCSKLNHEEDVYDNCNRTKACFGIPYGCLNFQDCNSVITIEKEKDSLHTIKILSKIMKHNQQMRSIKGGISESDKTGSAFMFDCNFQKCSFKGDEFQYNIKNCEPNENESKFVNVSEATVKLTQNDKNILCSMKINLKEAIGEKKDFHLLLNNGHKCELSKNKFDLDLDKPEAKFNYWIRIHGSLMIIAWIGCNSISIILSRYYKRNYADNVLFKKDLWFTFHSTLNYATFGMTCLAIFIVLCGVDKFHVFDFYIKRNLHGIFGVVTLLLTITQITVAYRRPKPMTKNRTKWKWFHWIVGYSTQTSAIAAIYFSPRLPKLELNENALSYFRIFTVYYFMMHVIMLALEFYERGSAAYEVFSSIERSDASKKVFCSKTKFEKSRANQYSKLREIILGLFLLVTFVYISIGIVTIWNLIKPWNFANVE